MFHLRKEAVFTFLLCTICTLQETQLDLPGGVVFHLHSRAAPTTEANTEPITETTTAATTEATTAPTTEAITAPTTEAHTAPTTESTTAPTTGATTAPTTEATTAPTTEATTVPTTEATTAPTTEVTTEATTTLLTAGPLAPTTPKPSTRQNDLFSQPTLDAFASAFKDAIKASPVLSDTFDLSKMDHSAIVSGYNKTVFAYVDSVGGPDVASEANLILQSIANNVQLLSSDTLIAIYSNTVAKYLMSLKILTPDNAASLVKQYLSAIIDETKAVPDVDPARKVAILAKSFGDFLTSQNAYDKTKTGNLGGYFAAEVYNQARPKKAK